MRTRVIGRHRFTTFVRTRARRKKIGTRRARGTRVSLCTHPEVQYVLYLHLGWFDDVRDKRNERELCVIMRYRNGISFLAKYHSRYRSIYRIADVYIDIYSAQLYIYEFCVKRRDWIRTPTKYNTDCSALSFMRLLRFQRNWSIDFYTWSRTLLFEF